MFTATEENRVRGTINMKTVELSEKELNKGKEI